MVATQSFSISRRALDVEDYIDIGRRHVSWIVGPAFFGVVVSIVVAFLLPNEYVSHATMQITPAQISDNLVQSTISTALNERIMQMQQNILSRSTLSSIINDPKLGLYKDKIKTMPLEDVIDEMKRNIDIQLVTLPGALSKRASAFNISFTYSDRVRAQQTVLFLMNKFDEENQATQKTQQDAVKGFVSDELQKARANLNEANDALTLFKQTNAGKLPDALQLNMTIEANLSAKITADSERIFRDENQLSALESRKAQAKGRLDMLAEFESQAEAAGLPGSPEAKENADLVQLNRQIDQLEFNLGNLMKQYGPRYPTVKGTKDLLDSFKAKRDSLMADQKAKADAEAAKPKEAAKKPVDIKQAQIRRDIQDELESIAVAMKSYELDKERAQAEQEEFKKQSNEVHQQLKDSTGLEAPYEDLRRNQQMAEQQYQLLLKDQHLADANSQLIQRKAGENLDVLDTATLPIQPSKPNRYMIIGAGFGLSVVLGFGMAAMQEAKDTSLKNLKDVRAYTNLPVLCSIPLLENTMLVKRKRRLAYLAWSAAVLVGAAAVSGAVVYYLTVTQKA